jgi:hypothetical protein
MLLLSVGMREGSIRAAADKAFVRRGDGDGDDDDDVGSAS